MAYKHEQEVILYKVTLPVNLPNFAFFSLLFVEWKGSFAFFTMKLQIFKINSKAGTERMGWWDAFSRRGGKLLMSESILEL